MASIIQDAIHQLDAGRRLTVDQADALATILLTESLPDDLILKFLHHLHTPYETLNELLGFITAMRRCMTPIHLNAPPLIDVCGTGGSWSNRFNTSTCVAMILGASGFRVVKHGNRGSRKPNGSMDFLDALRVPYDLSDAAHQAQLDQRGCTFLFAPLYHPAVKRVASARKQRHKPSIFNLIGPFCNPASPSIQFIGCPSHKMADRLMAVGRSWPYKTLAIISNDVGLDECSIAGPSRVLIHTNGQTETVYVDPNDVGIHRTLTDMSVGDHVTAVDNAQVFQSIIRDARTDHPITDLMAFNAAVIMHVMDRQVSIKEALVRARRVIDTRQLAWLFDAS